MTTPSRRELDFKTFDAMADDADRLRSAGYTRAAVWDLPRVCDHLTRYMRMSLTSFPSHAPWYRRLFERHVTLPMMLARRTMADRRAALASVQPLQPAQEPEAVAAFRAICNDVRDFHGEFAAHPSFGRLSPDDWRQVHLIHGAHHLGFLVPKKPEKPQAKPKETTHR